MSLRSYMYIRTSLILSFHFLSRAFTVLAEHRGRLWEFSCKNIDEEKENIRVYHKEKANRKRTESETKAIRKRYKSETKGIRHFSGKGKSVELFIGWIEKSFLLSGAQKQNHA